MENKSIRKNYLYNVVYQILLLIVPLVVTPYISRVLGADGVGIYSFISSVVSYFVLLATLGTITFGQREISYVQSDRVRRTDVFWELFLFRLIATFIVSLAYYIFCLFQRENQVIYYIFICNIISVATDISWFFQGLEEFGKIVVRNAVFKLLNIIFIFAFVKAKDDLALYAVGMCLIPVIGNLFLWPYLPRYINRININTVHCLKKTKEIVSLFIPTVAIQIYTVLDKTMIGVITKQSFENGYYEQAERIAKMALTIVTSLGVVMIPRIGTCFAQNKHKEIQEYMYQSYRFVWMIGIPICFGLIGIAANLIPWFLGPGYDDVIPLLHILSFLVLAIGISNVTGLQYLIPTKRQNWFTLTVCFGAIVNFGANLYLIYAWASMGAAIASVLAESAIAVTQLLIVRKELNLRHIIILSRKYLIAGIVMLIVLLFESSILVPAIVNTFIMVVSGITTYFIILFVLRDRFFITNLRMFIEKIHLKI